MKKKFDTRYLVFAVAAVWLVLTVFNYVIEDRERSDNENRYLQQFPSVSFQKLVDGEWQMDFEEYVNDQFILRDKFVELKAVAEIAVAKIEFNDVYYGDNILLEQIPPPDAEITADNIEGIKNFVQNFDVPSDIMLVPTASYVLSRKLPAFADEWDQGAYIDEVFEQLPEVNPINITYPLIASSDGYAYYRTDHHWTTETAYLAYAEYVKNIGLSPVPYNSEVVSTDFNGTLFSKSGIRFVEPDVIEAYIPSVDTSLSVAKGDASSQYDEIYFSEYLTQKDKYAYFLGTNEFSVTIHSDAPSDEKILVFKDSFSHCMAPMLAEHFSEVTLIDMRYAIGAVSDVVDIESYDRVLFMLSTTVFSGQQNTSMIL